MRYLSQIGQRTTLTARVTHADRHLYTTRPRFRVHSTVAPRECEIGKCKGTFTRPILLTDKIGHVNPPLGTQKKEQNRLLTILKIHNQREITERRLK